MVKSTTTYEGGLHCNLVHEPSRSVIETDAPKDNLGRGERFSPTDLVGAALASCILTTIAIVAERDGISVKGSRAEVIKVMISQPTRRVGSLSVRVTMPDSIPADHRAKLERVGLECPVKKSIHPDVAAPVEFVYEAPA